MEPIAVLYVGIMSAALVFAVVGVAYLMLKK